MIGTVLSGYRIVEKIRDGGASTVWKAEGAGGGAAVKVISEAWNADAAHRKAFKSEGELTQKLRHPAILRVIAYSDGPPRPYIVMEYFPSENLKFLLKNRPAEVQGRKASILKQAAEALTYLHSQGYVHRDVKPENLLVNPQGQVRLIDFSIALRIGERPPKSAGIEGTPTYMAPEQIRGEALDARADAYSFGVVAYETYAGRPPFVGTSIEAVLQDHLRKAPAPLRSVAKEAPAEVESFVRGLLQKKKEDRPSDLSMAIAALDGLAAGTAGPSSIKPRVVVQPFGDATLAILTEARITEGDVLQGMLRDLKRHVEKKEKPRVIINLEKVEYISSALLGKLVEVHKLCAQAGGMLKLCGIRPALVELLRITQLDKLFQVHPDAASAAAALRKAAK